MLFRGLISNSVKRIKQSNKVVLDPNEPSNAVMPTGTYCPACHEDAVAAKSNKKRRILDRLLSCLPRRERPIQQRCLSCGYTYTPFESPFDSRRNSDILESDMKRRTVLPLRPPSSAWVTRTGWTPQPELLELMNHVWCANCGLFVEKVNGTCDKCGTALKSNL
ncbi:hypothetical protein BJV82DRAFT_628586 [Fennellomyces sp. T-0311]|nr:hypothetical protein BJV82DRAFT_628586 [Fennellomyces sp. T-0311]